MDVRLENDGEKAVAVEMTPIDAIVESNFMMIIL